MRPARRLEPRPLAARPAPIPSTPTTFDEILPELRVHFPGFEDELRREFDVGFEIFKNDASASGVLYFLVLMSRHEFRRRLRFVASHLRSQLSDDQAERFAIQNEGGPRGSDDKTIPPARGGTTPAQADHLAGPGRIPPRPSGS